MALQLKRASVAELYECTTDVDITIHISCYSGPLSNINECGARALVRSGSPLLVEKPQPPDEEETN